MEKQMLCDQCGKHISRDGIMVTQDHKFVCSRNCESQWIARHHKALNNILFESDTFAKFMLGEETKVFKDYDE